MTSLLPHRRALIGAVAIAFALLAIYRAVTVSWGYSGDSILNSLADVGWMVIGFLLAARLPVWTSVALALAFELFTLVMIRDNLTLNILMLLWPIDSLRQWQAMA